MEEGGTKYGYFNYRIVGVKSRVYVAALLRHVFKWLSGEDRDPKTGVHHLGSARACLGIILDAESCGQLIDNRPPSIRDASTIMDKMEVRVSKVREVFKDRDPRHFTIADRINPYGAETGDETKAENREATTKDYTPREDGKSVQGRDSGQLVLGPEEGFVGGVQMDIDYSKGHNYNRAEIERATKEMVTRTERGGQERSGDRRVSVGSYDISLGRILGVWSKG